MVHDDSFVEQVNALPDRLHPGQVVDWTVHWQGRQHVSSRLAAASSLAAVLQQHAAHSLTIQVFNTPSDTWDDRSNLNSYTSAAAGLSVTATFAVDLQAVNNRAAIEGLLETKFRRLLLTLLSERWILGSLESVHSERLHRFVHVDWQNLIAVPPSTENDDKNPTTAARVPVVLWLSHEAFSLSAEGIQAFLQNAYPCQNAAGILAVHSATEWSNLLLGYEGDHHQSLASSSSISIAGRRGLWMQATANDNNGHESYQIDIGLTWRIRTKGPTVAWSSLLGDAKQTLNPCPLADATRFTVLDNPAVQVTTNASCNDLAWNNPNILQEDCIRIPTDIESKSSSVSKTNTLSVQTNLWRTKGPGHSGRIETVVDNPHESCAARVQIWHVIPPVLQPIWSSFDSSMTTTSVYGGGSTTMLMVRPQRRWKHDGTIELTLNTNLTANSVLRYGFDYDPVFLPIESFPADPNRGFEMPPVRVLVEPLCTSSDRHAESSFALFSESLLFLSPLPDASMPFNVLSLSCTLVAFVIGSMLNLLVRRASEKVKYTLYPDQQPKSKFQKFKELVRKKIQSIRGMKEKEESGKKQKDD